MREIEVKILEIDRKKVESKLISLGAKKIFDGEIDAYFFDFKDDSLRKSDLMLRLRKEERKIVLTFKKPIKENGAKILEESEIEVSDFDTTKIILNSLGLQVWKRAKKHRTTYSLGDTHFELDKYIEDYNFIPEFLEIEAKNIDDIHKFIEALGFKKSDCKPWTLQDLIKYYSKK